MVFDDLKTPSTVDGFGGTKMSEITLTDIDATVDAHLAGYCEPDPTRRLQILSGVWSRDGRLVDPPFEAASPAGIAALVDAVLTHYPDHAFRRTTAVDLHHEFARYGWELVGPAGKVAVAGTDVVTLDGNGMIATIIGFFGELTPA